MNGFKLGRVIRLHETKEGIIMKKIKLTILAILVAMYQIALSDNGIVKLFSWFLFVGLFMVLVIELEKRYGTR